MSNYIGLDIGSESVKAVFVRTAYRKTTLAGLGKSDVASAGTVEAAIKAAIAEAAKGASIDGLATSLEGSRVAVRAIDVPAAAERQLTDVLPFEIEAATPLDMAESVFDHHVLSASKQKGGPALEVLVAVARTEDVRARIDLVKRATGVEPERVGVANFSVAELGALLPSLEEPGPIAIVDLGKSGSELVLLAKGEPVFGRSLAVGTEGLPQTAAKLAREIRLSLSGHKARGGAPPTMLYLCGGGAFVSGAESFLSAELELPVKMLPSPTLGLELSPELQPKFHELPLYAKSLALAFGLTSRGESFDLRRGPLVYERGFGWIRERVPVLAGLAAVILVSFVFSTGMQLYAASKEHEALAGALGSVSKEVLGESAETAARANELLAAQTSTGDDDPMPHADAFDVIVRISEAIPQSMVHDIEELDFQKNHVVIHGVVGTVADAQSIASSLKSDKCFQEVKITRTSQVVGGERQKYVLELDLKCPEDQKAAPKKPSAAASASAPQGGK